MTNDEVSLEKGDRIEAEFNNLGKKGDPMFHYGETDFVIFVDEDSVKKMDQDLSVGDSYELVINKMEDTCAFGTPAEIYDKFNSDGDE